MSSCGIHLLLFSFFFVSIGRNARNVEDRKTVTIAGTMKLQFSHEKK
jgi:hypothetical protein